MSFCYPVLITSDTDNCSTHGMLRNSISCVRAIAMVKAKITITNRQSIFHNLIVIHKVQLHRETRYD